MYVIYNGLIANRLCGIATSFIFLSFCRETLNGRGLKMVLSKVALPTPLDIACKAVPSDGPSANLLIAIYVH